MTSLNRKIETNNYEKQNTTNNDSYDKEISEE